MSGKLKISTAPESTETRTSEYADFQVLPVIISNESDVINFSVISKSLSKRGEKWKIHY